MSDQPPAGDSTGTEAPPAAGPTGPMGPASPTGTGSR